MRRTVGGLLAIGGSVAFAPVQAATSAAERFDPTRLGDHVTIPVAFAVRTAKAPTVDGKADEVVWAPARPITGLRASTGGGSVMKSLYLGGSAKSGGIAEATDPTFVRLLFDETNLYLCVVALVAPREAGTHVAPPVKDALLLRFDPHARGQHALELGFNAKGITQQYDSHETWACGFAPRVEFSGCAFAAKDAPALPPDEQAALARLGPAASGWMAELAIPWSDLANSHAPAPGSVWGLQVARSSAAGQESSWNRNTFNSFDPQGHVAFVPRPPAATLTALTFGRTLPGLTPWTAFFENRSAAVAQAGLKLRCDAQDENLEFAAVTLGPGESRRRVTWIPYVEGVNQVHAEVREGSQVVYSFRFAPWVARERDERKLDASGGFAELLTGAQSVSSGAGHELTLRWEADVRGRNPLGEKPGDILVYALPAGAGGEAAPLALLDVKETPAEPAPFSGGSVTLKVKVPEGLGEGFAQWIAVPRARLKAGRSRAIFRPGAAVAAAELAEPERHADLFLRARFYVAGAELERLRSFFAEARKKFEQADGLTAEKAKEIHWGTVPPAIPAHAKPDDFTALMGAKYNIIEAEKLLGKIPQDCSLLDALRLYEDDLKARLGALEQGKRPETGILWRTYPSQIDGAPQPYCLYVPEAYEPGKTWSLIIDLHGYGGGWSLTPEQDKILAARGNGCFLLKPYLRGPTWYLRWGEREFVDLVDVVRRAYNIDADRIFLTGFSMGGSGTMSLMAAHPDLIAAGGGSSGRAEPLKGERLGQTPIWISDGFKDQGTPWTGGRMFVLHAAEVEPVGARHRGAHYTGHGFDLDKTALYSWFLAHPMDRWPRRLSFTVVSARWASLRWVRQVEPARYGRSARVTAGVSGQTLELVTENAAGLRCEIGRPLLDPARPISVVWNGQPVRDPVIVPTANPETREVRVGTLARDAGPGQKVPNRSAGPLDDLAFNPFLIVPCAADGQAVTQSVEKFLDDWHHTYQGKPPVVADTELTEKQLADNHVVCVGNPEKHAVLKKHLDRLPLRMKDGRLVVGKQAVEGKGVAWWCLMPNPANSARYLLVVGAENPDSVGPALMSLRNITLRYYDYAVFGGTRPATPYPMTRAAAKIWNLSAVGCLDRDWRVYEDAELLPDLPFMDNQDPSLSLSPDGEWLPGKGPRR